MNRLRSNTPRISSGIFVLCAAISLTTIAGCGFQTYEERTETTKQYYDYVDRLNHNLGPQFADSGISVRIPKQFTLLPAPKKRRKKAPKKPKAVAGEVVEVAPKEKVKDPRQPDYLDVEFPGLVAAWRADLNTVSGTGDSSQTATIPGTIYLLSNYELWGNYKGKNQTIKKSDPLKFHEQVIGVLEDGLHIRIDERARGSASNRINKWFTETVPKAKDEQFAPKKEVRTITLVPEVEEGETGIQREYQVYLFKNGDMKIVLIYALPRNVSTGEDLQDRILFSLQTLNVSPEKPAKARGNGKAKSSPGGNKPTSF